MNGTVILGVDPHKASHTAAAVDAAGAVLETLRVPASRAGLVRLLEWACQWADRRWAVEGAFGLGHQLAQHLLAQGENVVDVPAALAARARLLGGRSGRKTDPDDAVSVAHVARARTDLRPVVAEEHATACRLLTEHRQALTTERTRTVNRLHRLLRDLLPGGAPRKLTAAAARQLLRRVSPAGLADTERVRLARDLITAIIRLDKAIADNRTRLDEIVAASGTTLTAVHGVGSVVAAKILGATGDVRRFPSRDHYASYAATAPVAASSGERIRHRLNQGGNRQLNGALHTAALVQATRGPGRAYYLRKIAEGKTRREAMRALKRQLTNTIYAQLLADTRRQADPTQSPPQAA